MTGPFGSGSFGTSEFGNSPLFNTSSLIDAVLRATNHLDPSTQTNRRLLVLNFLNNRYATVTTKRPWDWLYQTVDILLKAPYETGTVSIDNRSQNVVGTGTFFDANVVPNNFLILNTRSDRYAISDVTSNTALELEGQFAGDDLADSAYKIIKPVYTAPSDMETLQSLVLGESLGELVPIGTQEMNRKRQYDLTAVGIPRWVTEVGRRSQDGVRTFEVYPAPDQDYTAQLSYGVNIEKLQDSVSNFPLIPDRHRVVLYYGAMAEMAMFQKDETAAIVFEKKFESTLLNMQGDAKLTDSKYILKARRGRRGRRRTGYLGYSISAEDFGRED